MSRLEGPRIRVAAAIALACALALAGTLGTAATFTARGSVPATVRTGGVAVEVRWTGEPEPAPLATGTPVAAETDVANLGDACWVRARVSCSVEGAAFGEARWDGRGTALGAGWEAADDGWWYRTAPLAPGETCKFDYEQECPAFEQAPDGAGGWEWRPVSAAADPAKWSAPSPDPGDDPSLRAIEGAEGADLRVSVTVEAVQEANVEPDFSSASPWGGIEAEGSETTEGGAR